MVAAVSDGFGGVIGRTYRESTPWWPAVPRAPRGAPNVVFIVLDDVGFCRSRLLRRRRSRRRTWTRLAAGGLRYTNFHMTSMCSPTRACLLTGRNAHAVGLGIIAEWSSGFPGYQGRLTPARGHAGRGPARPRLRDLSPWASGIWAPVGGDGGRAVQRLAARARVRPLVRVPRRAHRSVAPGAVRGQPRRSHDPAAPRLPPERGSGRPCHRLRPRPSHGGAATGRSSSTWPSAPATGRTTSRAPTSSGTEGATTGAGTASATSASPGRRRLGIVPPDTRAGPAQPGRRRPGASSRPTSGARRPPAGGLRGLPGAHRRADRPAGRYPRRDRPVSTTR